MIDDFLNEDYEEEIEELKNKLEEKCKQLDKAYDIINSQKDMIEELKNQINQLYQTCDEYKYKLEDKEEEFNKYKKEQRTLTINLKLKIQEYENLQKENNVPSSEEIEKYEQKIKEKDKLISNLKQEIKEIKDIKNNKDNNTIDPELKKTIKEQNKTIQHLRDELILKDKKIKKLEKPIDKSFTSGERKIYNHIEEIDNYEKEYNYYFKNLQQKNKNGKKYKLNITKYKEFTDYKSNKKSMKYLEDLGIERNASERYEMSDEQFDALIEKVVLYRYNEGIYKH